MTKALLLLLLSACGKKQEAVSAPVPAPEKQMVAAPAPQPQIVKVWVETDEKKCNSNAWDNYKGIGGVVGYFGDEKKIKVYDTAKLTYNQLYGRPTSTCRECSCPSGDVLYLWVAKADAPLLQAYGFRAAVVDPLVPDSYMSSRRSGATVVAPAPAPAPAIKKKTTKPATRKKKRRR